MMLGAEGCPAGGWGVKAGLGWKCVKNQHTLTISLLYLYKLSQLLNHFTTRPHWSSD